MKRFLMSAVPAFLFACNTFAFELISTDLMEGQPMKPAQEYKGFGCEGGNLSPALAWKDIPAGTRSFAVTVYDPDAPTGSGWWHWVAYNIPVTATSLPAGAVVKTPLPTGTKQGKNDFGERNFGGACPPKGDKPHHYIHTVYALKVDKLDVPDDASPALIGFMIHSNILDKAFITSTYAR